MAVPKWNELIEPVLTAIFSQKSINRKALSEIIINKFKLNRNDIQEVIPRTNVPKYKNNLAWTTIHLTKMGIISENNGNLSITETGNSMMKYINGEIDGN